MRVIPVLDLREGVAVHAVRGERTRYLPVESVLAPSADPVELARALATRLGARECYVADLDAIARRGDHGPVIRAIGGLGLSVWLDAGTATPADAERAMAQGATRLIIGTETLRDPRDLGGIVGVTRAAARSACVLSLDFRDGRLLGGSPAVERLDPRDLAAEAWAVGIRAYIVLDLTRVGSNEGARLGPARALRRDLPDAELIVGGGVRDRADLLALQGEGFQGALVATALHRGIVTSLTVDATT